jgi:hypothetical protein
MGLSFAFEVTWLKSFFLHRFKVLGEGCFSKHRLLSSATFESELRIPRIDGWAFKGTDLVEIILPVIS